jgi:hypothetical protein
MNIYGMVYNRNINGLVGGFYEHSNDLQVSKLNNKKKPFSDKKLRGFGSLTNYADRATAASWRSSTNFCGQRVLRGQRNGSPPVVFSVFLTGAATISST